MQIEQRITAMTEVMHRSKAIGFDHLISDMTPGEVRLLSVICRTDEAKRKVSDLYEACEMHPTAVSRLMNSLEEKELIVRTPRKGNRRVTDVCATERGKAINQRNDEIIQNFWQAVLSRVPEEDFDAMLRITREMLGSMEQVLAEISTTQGRETT